MEVGPRSKKAAAGPPAEGESPVDAGKRRGAEVRLILDDGVRPIWDVASRPDGVVIVSRSQVPGECWLVGSKHVAAVVEEFVRGPHPETRRLVVTMSAAELETLPLDPRAFDVLTEPLNPARTTIAIRNALDAVDATLANQATAKALMEVESEEEALMEIASALASERHIDRLLSQMLLRFRQLTDADAGSIWTVERAADLGPAGLAAGGSPDVSVLSLRTCQNDSVAVTRSAVAVPISAESIVGYAALSAEPVHLEDTYNIDKEAPYTFGANMDRHSGYRTRSMLSIPMHTRRGELIGVIQLINRKTEPDKLLRTRDDVESFVRPFDPHHVRLASTLAANAAISLENASLYEQIQRLFDRFVDASVFAIEARDPTTSGHSHRVAAYSAELMRTIDMSRSGPLAESRFSLDDHRVLRYAALLHDFGKVSVSEDVLRKAKKLRPLEMQLVERRIHYAIRTLEARAMSRKLDAIDALGLEEARGRFAAWDAELGHRRGTLASHLDMVRTAAEPRVLDEEVSHLIQEAASILFVDHDGVQRPLLRPEEVTALSIRRGSLTGSERAEIESHVLHTERFLRQLPWTGTLTDVPEIASRHHEKLDGSGYPHGLDATQLPLAARMLTIADIFDALTARDRPYKAAVPIAKALDILGYEVKAGKIDGQLVDVFVEARVWEAARRQFPEHVL